MSITATYTFDSNEHYRAMRAVTRMTKARWLSWAFAAVAIVLVGLNIAAGWRHGLTTVLLNVMPWVLVVGFSIAIIPISQWRAARRLPERDRSLQGVQERSVDEAGYHSKGNGVVLDIPWHTMVRGAETDTVFLFFYNRQCAYYLPKRAISVAEVTAVRDLMRRHLSDVTGLRG